MEVLVVAQPGCFDCKQIYNRTSNTCVPAEISSKDVEQLVPVYQRVEDCAVRPVDHVALIGRPPRHFPIKKKQDTLVLGVVSWASHTSPPLQFRGNIIYNVYFDC